MYILDIYTEVDESVNALWPTCAYQEYETCPTTDECDGDECNEAKERREGKNKEGGNNNSQQHDHHDDGDDKSVFAVN
jgi:hypothetical protein